MGHVECGVCKACRADTDIVRAVFENTVRRSYTRDDYRKQVWRGRVAAVVNLVRGW